MNHLFLTILILTTLSFSSAVCEENTSVLLHNAKIGFQQRWESFQKEKKEFVLWSSDWKEEELKTRLQQMNSDREKIYFTNPEECQKSKKSCHCQKLYETNSPSSSRYDSLRVFNYNAASDHYNASIITLHGQKFLAMEGPIKGSLRTFFEILESFQVTDLVRLTPSMFKGKENSFPYWEGRCNINPKNGRTTLQIDDREINYFFTDLWTEGNVIQPERLIALVKAVLFSDHSQMIAVHCKAGVNRTGAFIAACALIRQIDEQIAKGIPIDQLQISIDKIVWELSLQRPFMISRLPQYKTLYQMVSTYVESLKKENSPQK